MNYKESREYLKQVNIYGSVLGLKSIKELLNRLDNPQDDLKVVHFSGTNGKGSTGSFLQSILMKAGYKVGRYSSPAVFDYREIIKVDDKIIDKDSLAEYISCIKEKCDEMTDEGLSHPTPFEIETAMAFLHLRKSKCDICLIECGMGGETDATNVFQKVLCSVITNISLDHTQFLGNTVEEIARVKAGIIKENCPVAIAKQQSQVVDIIRSIANKKQAILTVANEATTFVTDFKVTENMNLYSKFDYKTTTGKNICANLKMLGNYQLKNAALAVEVAEILENQGYKLSEYVKAGLENAIWFGRMEVINYEPLFIIDGAHNPEAVEELKRTIDLYFTNKRIAFIMGVLNDKNFDEEARIIAEKATHIITVTPNNPRALDGEILKNTLSRYNENVEKADSLEQAVNDTLQMTYNKKVDLIIAFGTLSHLREIKEIITKKCAKN